MYRSSFFSFSDPEGGISLAPLSRDVSASLSEAAAAASLWQPSSRRTQCGYMHIYCKKNLLKIALNKTENTSEPQDDEK